MSRNVLGIEGEQVLLNGSPLLLKGLRLSAALLNDATTDGVLDSLERYRFYGLNSFSVFLMGNRFLDLKGYREDGAIAPEVERRLIRILEEADRQNMVVLVGCLYRGCL